MLISSTEPESRRTVCDCVISTLQTLLLLLPRAHVILCCFDSWKSCKLFYKTVPKNLIAFFFYLHISSAEGSIPSLHPQLQPSTFYCHSLSANIDRSLYQIIWTHVQQEPWFSCRQEIGLGWILNISLGAIPVPASWKQSAKAEQSAGRNVYSGMQFALSKNCFSFLDPV